MSIPTRSRCCKQFFFFFIFYLLELHILILNHLFKGYFLFAFFFLTYFCGPVWYLLWFDCKSILLAWQIYMLCDDKIIYYYYMYKSSFTTNCWNCIVYYVIKRLLNIRCITFNEMSRNKELIAYWNFGRQLSSHSVLFYRLWQQLTSENFLVNLKRKREIKNPVEREWVTSVNRKFAVTLVLF